MKYYLQNHPQFIENLLLIRILNGCIKDYLSNKLKSNISIIKRIETIDTNIIIYQINNLPIYIKNILSEQFIEKEIYTNICNNILGEIDFRDDGDFLKAFRSEINNYLDKTINIEFIFSIQSYELCYIQDFKKYINALNYYGYEVSNYEITYDKNEFIKNILSFHNYIFSNNKQEIDAYKCNFI